MNPDSAAAIDAKSEAPPFRSEVNGSLPPSGHRSSVLDEKFKSHNNEVRNIEKDFEISELGAFATPGLHLAPVPVALIAESGMTGESLIDFLPAALNPSEPWQPLSAELFH
jgi:hypothetical protein